MVDVRHAHSRDISRILTGLFVVLGLLVARDVSAEVVRVVVDRRELVLEGRTWGDRGAYEKLVGRIFFEFDPANPANAAIVDLGRAPLNAAGRVEAWADFMVLQPRDPGLRRGVAWLEVSNRGGKASLRYFQRATGRAWDPVSPSDFGDGLLFRQGLTVIWVGWQWDVPTQEGLLRLHVPLARGSNGPLEGLVRADWVVDRPVERLSLGHRGHRAYAPVSRDHPDHVLTVRDGREEPRIQIPGDRWSFVPDARGQGRLTSIELDGGFEAGRIYELVYRAADPRVVGLGLAVVRDVMSYAKYDLDSAFPARRGVAFGVSQTGRFLRHFLYQGFNVDEGDRKVFDGMLIHTAGAGRGSFNHRFGQPSRDAHRYSAFFYPTDVFPFTSRRLVDPVTGWEGGILEGTPVEQRPYVFYTNTGYEYWGRAASLIHTSPQGLADVLPLPNERIYALAGGQHFVGGFPPGSGDLVAPSGDGSGPPVYRGNPLDFLPVLRALAVRLVGWVEDGVRPPASAYPTLGEGTLVAPAGVAFPRIGSLRLPRAPHVAYRADYGPRFREEGIITMQPPELGEPFPSLVSQVDGLGNEIGGLRTVELRVPLATYTPWSLRGTGAPAQHDEMGDFVGSFVPLPRDEAERAQWDDPRPSVAALYGSRTDYMRRVVAALQDLVNEGLLLGEDAGRVSATAAELWDWYMGTGPGG
jgi:hypothetical protein